MEFIYSLFSRLFNKLVLNPFFFASSLFVGLASILKGQGQAAAVQAMQFSLGKALKGCLSFLPDGAVSLYPYIDTMSLVMAAVGKISALYVQMVIPMTVFTNLLAAGIAIGMACVFFKMTAMAAKGVIDLVKL